MEAVTWQMTDEIWQRRNSIIQADIWNYLVLYNFEGKGAKCEKN